MADKISQLLGVSGNFTVKRPWVIDSNAVLKVIGVRSFDDIYKKGEDVYETYYVPYGAINNTNIDNRPFSFDEETKRFPNIVTLMTAQGGVYYVPDTFITSYPTAGAIAYSHRVLSVSLGPLPDYLDTTSIRNTIADAVVKELGIVRDRIVVQDSRAALLTNPSLEDHQAMEAARIGSIQFEKSKDEQIIELQNEVTKLKRTIQNYEAVITQQGKK